MTALQTSQAPLMIRLPDGRIIPASGGALADVAPPTPAAAVMDDTGALSAHPMMAAGDGGALVPAAAKSAQIIDMAKHRGGAAAGPGVPVPRQPDAIVDQNQPSGGDLLNLIKGISAATGKLNAAPAGTGEANGGGDFIGAGSTPPAIPPSAPAIPPPSQPDASTAAPAASEPGFLDRMKSFLGIGDTAAPPPAPAAAAVPAPAIATGPMPSPQVQGALTNAAPAVAAPTGAIPAPAAAAAPGTGGFFDQMIDHGDPLTRNPGQAQTMATRYGDDYKAPSWFDRLSANPLRMALLQGGLATMSAASRPGATPLGALGEGALTGMKGSVEQRMAQQEEGLKEQREASEAGLREKQGEFYGTKGAALTETADTNKNYKGALAPVAQQKADAATSNAQSNAVKAGAAAKTADARMIAAQKAADGTKNPTALIKNAQWLVDNKVAPDLATAVSTLRSAARNPGQRAALVTARAKLYLSSSIAPSDSDVAMAKKNAERDVDSDLSAAAPGKSGGALGNGGGQSGGALADAQYAIAHGAPRDKVIQRAKAQGLDTSGL